MKVYSLIGSRLRLEPCISSLVTKTYITKDVELKLITTESKEDGVWFYVTDDDKKGWIRSDFLKKTYDDE